ncbi:chromatin-remodeling ATPase INO80 [Nymphaea colorata]|nr:chromatin-remodeling ATPase INO80 [Nymphaea colorata]
MDNGYCLTNNGYSLSNLFNLEPLMNFQIPHQDDDFDDCASSSQDESRGTQGRRGRLNGNAVDTPEFGLRMRRVSHRDAGSNDEDDGEYGTRISEEDYRSMLTEHVERYRRVRFKGSSNLVASNTNTTGIKRSTHTKRQRLANEVVGSFKDERSNRGVEVHNEIYADISPHKHETNHEMDFSNGYLDRYNSVEPVYLDIGEGVVYRIPPTYEYLAPTLGLPSFSDIRIEEYLLTGPLDASGLGSIMALDRRTGGRSQGMGETLPTYESLQARVKSLASSNSVQKFNLQVCDLGLDSSSIPEGAAGGIQRSIMSDMGILQVHYVKVLEKGDTYEIIERRLPKKQVVKKDPSVIEKEERDKLKKAWDNMLKNFGRHYKMFVNFHRKQVMDAKKFSESCQREVKLRATRSLKYMRGAPMRTRKLARDMLVFWKRMDRELAELRKKEERDAAEALKREEELREAKRQQQRLNFLLSQTELYSHFMQNKSAPQTSESLPTTEGDTTAEGVPSSLVDLKSDEEEDPEETALKREALKAAQHAASEQKKLTSAFDSECMKLREGVDIEVMAAEASIEGSSNIDLLHPSTMPVGSSVQTPELFKGCLKEYQLKGLQWLVNCYDQGLNGILADEMGLGKTIQAMAFLAHLAEEKNIWGPFLVVAPASVLNNWADEVSRFCPDLKTLPYWGGLQERTILRKNINPKRLYRRESCFHILITSYQLLVMDEKYFKRVKWQYMVLDEAQAIKSSSSIRWKTLLSFNCRNRLLLTGTPIQNNMAELWALLHFIMPTLFDSHEQFNEWFSKGIENHAEHGGTLNEHQLNRLHAVLKPFMLRRVKKDVISEMTSKKEITVHCKLSSRQQAFYQAIKNKISISELFDGSRGHLNEKKILSLMNIVIQLRKVCNHPELFERNEGNTSFYFGEIPSSLLPPPFGELEDVHYAGSHNPIKYEIPKLVYQETLRDAKLPHFALGHVVQSEVLERLFNIYAPENVYRSVSPQAEGFGLSIPVNSGTFGFSRLIDVSPEEFSYIAKVSVFERLLFAIMAWNRKYLDEIIDSFLESEDSDPQFDGLGKATVKAVTRMLLLPTRSDLNLLRRKFATGSGNAPYEGLVTSHHDRFISNIRLINSTYTFIPRGRAPPVDVHCSDRSFAYQLLEELHHPWLKRLFVGFARTSEFNGPRRPLKTHHLIQEIDAELPIVQPVLQLTYKVFGSSPPMQSFDPAKMLTDSGKLQTLDILLKRLRAENHRVLLFAQMTKMLNILEDYMNYRKYRYLRLDGSSTIMDRRDMVRDFQCRNDIFVFLLSTRAGGLGINLTAADTVIFYESDWNPTLDLQAMDRAHRLGQTKEVTVYRLICKETVEEKILQRASQKNTVQQLVMTGGHVQGDLLAPEDVVSLLLDDTQLEQKLREIPLQARERQKKKRATKGIRVDAEGDASLEDLTNVSGEDAGGEQAPERVNEKAGNKKRKANSDKQAPSRQRKSQKDSKNVHQDMEVIHNALFDYDEDFGKNMDVVQPKVKSRKRTKTNVNDDSLVGSNTIAEKAVDPSEVSPLVDLTPLTDGAELGEESFHCVQD